ncbi:MAG: bifunctional folylpolyglutamate synthase/dihydrofolate synthase [Armatimonadetes bacterium]|nr:bifunctional folylpolyglutamate synthase/dihydrofolate synthase [Armatimonadota bacterium]
MKYAEARAYIASLQGRGWRLELDRMREFVRLLDNPERGCHCFHVAGTNGKGSVTAMIASVLKESGFRVGSFFSPFVYDFRERIQINGEMISEQDIARLTELLIPISEHLSNSPLGGPTEFEFKTAMGFYHWAEEKCDYVALEVGLGGRLDATNIIEKPVVAIISQVGMDHQQYLGDTIEKIAAEKAGIFKRGCPAVSGATDERAKNAIRHGRLWRIPEEFSCTDDSITTPVKVRSGIETNLLGGFQRHNLAVAVAAIDASGIAIPEEDLCRGLMSVSLPGRMEVVRRVPTVIFDGAHNQQAAESVATSITAQFPGKQVRLVFGSATGHEPSGVLRAFAPLLQKAYVCEIAHERAQPLAQIVSAAVTALDPARIQVCAGVSDAIRQAVGGCRETEIVLVTGSFYLLGEANTALEDLT